MLAHERPLTDNCGTQCVLHHCCHAWWEVARCAPVPLARHRACPFWSGPSVSSMTPTGLPRADPDGVERVHLTVLGDAKEVDPKGGAKAGGRRSAAATAVSRTTPAKIATPSASGGIRWSSCPRIACRCPARHWQSWHSLRRIDAGCPVARTSTCFTSSGPTLTRAGSYPTSRCTHEVPCLGTWSRVGQHDCFRVKTGLMAGAERGNTVRAGGICGPRDECSLAAGWLPRSSESS